MPDTTLIQTENQIEIVRRSFKKFGLEPGSTNSNLLTPTSKKGVFDIENPLFNPMLESVPDNLATSERKRKPLKSRSGYPYHPAQLNHHNYDITKHWYITFYAWDIGREQLVRKRVMKDDLDEIRDLNQRIAYAKKAVDKINEYLKNDYHLNRTPFPKMLAMDFKGYSLINAIVYAINEKRQIKGIKESSLRKYESALTTLKDFLSFKGLQANYPLRNLTAIFITQYFDYLKTERKASNKTYNDRKAFLHAMFEVLIKKSDHTLFRGKNPFQAVQFLPTQSRKHAAFTDQQLQDIVAYARSRNDFHVVLFMQFMYFTLARPEELRKLKVGNIDLARRKILFKASEAKTSIEEYVGINDRFYQIIQESGIMKYPPHYYVFSNELVSKRAMIDDGAKKNPGRADTRSYAPAETPVGMNYFGDAIAGYIEDLKLDQVNPNFTPYGIKHTGAIGLYLATKDPKVVQIQCRHKKLETTLKYLRDLGVFIDFDQINKWSGPI